MSISSDEVNFLIYRYLQENGFSHSAFTFAYESLVVKSSVAQTEIPPGALITFLQKGLEYIGIEEHINEDGSIQEFDNSYSLLSPVICEAVAVKEDRRVRRVIPSDSSTPMEQQEVESSSEGMVVGVPPSKIAVLNGETGTRYLQLSGHQSEVFMCMWNPIRKQLASGSADGMCRLWGLWEMDEKKWSTSSDDVPLATSVMPHLQVEGQKGKDVTSLAWSPDGLYLATGCYDGLARIWDSSGALHMVLTEHTGPIYSLKWSKSGKYILSGSFDRRAIIWSAATGTVLKIYDKLHNAPVLDVDWNPNGTNSNGDDIFATCSIDGSINVCCADSFTPLKVLKGHKTEVNAVSWSPDGTMLASCSDDGTAKIWTMEEGLKFDLVGHSKEIFNIKWTPTGPGSANPEKPLYLCSASFDGSVKIWDSTTGALVHSLSPQPDIVRSVYSLDPSPNGEFVATGSLGGVVSIWSVTSGQLIREMIGSGDAFDVSWSSDGSLLCASFSTGTLYILDTLS